MNWGAYIGLFGFSMVKFLFTPFGGPALKLSFYETYLSCCAGAILSSIIFYYSSNYFMERAATKAKQKLAASIASGVPLKKKKKFTRMNKFIVKIKRSIGMIGICFYAPLFLSIPVGSIIVAKFYGDSKLAYPLIILGIFVNGAIVTGGVYLFA